MDNTIQIPATSGLHLILVQDGHYSTVSIDPFMVDNIDQWGSKAVRELRYGIKAATVDGEARILGDSEDEADE